jgi:hypothetical protein
MTRGTYETQTMETMAMQGHRYRVEVSGWDTKENFFVEKTSLDWKEREGKTVALHVAVRVDSVLFVRLLRPLGSGADFPVPHRAVKVAERDQDASCKDVRLEQLQPRKGVKDSMVASIERLIGGSVHN